MHGRFKLTRRLRLFLETLTVLVMLMLSVVGWGMWRLSQGPIDLKPFLPTLARSFNSWFPGISFSIQEASLEWGGQSTPFLLHVEQVNLTSRRGRPIGTVDEMALGLAPQSLLLGQIAPTSLDIVSPSVTITRYPDGHIALRFDRDDETDDKKSGLNWQEGLKLLSTDHYAFTAFLQRISVTNLTVRYRDFITQQNLVGDDGKLYFERTGDNFLIGGAVLYLPVGNDLKAISVKIAPDKENNVSLASAQLPSLAISDIAAMFPDNADLKNISGNIDTTATLAIDKDLHTAFADLFVATTDMTVTLPDLFPKPLDIKTAGIGIRYKTEDKTLALRDTKIVLPHTTLTAKASITDPFRKGALQSDNLTLTAEAGLKGLGLDHLYRYWPLGMAHSARAWVTNHIKDGKATKAFANVVLTLPYAALDKGQFDQITLKSLDGEIKFKNLTCDYLPPMLPVKQIDGLARFNADEFIIEPTAGLMRGTNVLDGTITIAPLSGEQTDLVLDLKLQGPLQDALVLLAQKPVEFTQKVGIDSNMISGQATTDLHLDFPLLNDLELEQLNAKATASLKNITVRKAYRDATLYGEDLNLTVDNDGLTLLGKARLSDASLSSLTWNEYFGDKSELRRQFLLKGHATAQLLKDLHFDATGYIENHATVDARITEKNNGDTDITLDADLTPARIIIPELNVDKPAGQTGRLSMIVDAPQKGTGAVKDLNVASSALTFSKGAITFDAQKNLQEITIPLLKAGRSTFNVRATALPRNNGWNATIRGASLDASGFWNSKSSDTNESKTKPPIKLALDVGTLYLNPELPFQNAKGQFFVDNDVILQADLNAKTENSVFAMRFAPGPNGNRILRIDSNNAGESLRALSVTDSMQGGTLKIIGGSDAATPQQIRGTIDLREFTLIKAPVLARLLNAFSLGGLLELLNQKGLRFSKMEGEFLHQGKQIIMKKGRMAGASLGLNFSGVIDQKKDRFDMSGTIVPIQGINKLVSGIPLIGQILTGLKGEGLVAATYTIKGPTDNPSVMVNPLSVLTPGILRSIFFENNKD